VEGQRWNFFKVRPPVSICPVLVPTLRRQPAMVNPKFRGRASSKTMNPRADLEDLAPVTGGAHSLYRFAPNHLP